MAPLQDIESCGVGVQYAATLGSTAEILSAIKAAQLWRQGMLAGQKPTRHISQSVRVLPLPPLENRAPCVLKSAGTAESEDAYRAVLHLLCCRGLQGHLN